jgi:hypothetical protein
MVRRIPRTDNSIPAVHRSDINRPTTRFSNGRTRSTSSGEDVTVTTWTIGCRLRKTFWKDGQPYKTAKMVRIESSSGFRNGGRAGDGKERLGQRLQSSRDSYDYGMLLRTTTVFACWALTRQRDLPGFPQLFLKPYVASINRSAVCVDHGPWAIRIKPKCSRSGLLRLFNYYFSSCASTSGSTVVPSALTASSVDGSSPSAFTTVGATCAVVVVAETVCAEKAGFATSRTTLVSSCANPP